MPNPAQLEFDRLRHQATHLLEQAARLPGLSDIEIHQVRAAAGIAGVVFHKISIHGADPIDMQNMVDDLRHIAAKVDPLIEAIGAEAMENTSACIDGNAFKDAVLTGLESSFSELSWAADKIAEDADIAREKSDREEHGTLHRAYQGV